MKKKYLRAEQQLKFCYLFNQLSSLVGLIKIVQVFPLYLTFLRQFPFNLFYMNHSSVSRCELAHLSHVYCIFFTFVLNVNNL